MDDIVAPDLSHEQRFDRLTEIAVQVGLGLAPGQELVISVPIEALPRPPLHDSSTRNCKVRN